MKWHTSKFKGVRYREHPTRKHGIMPDRYFALRFQFEGKRKEEGLGWSSEGWTERKAVLQLEELKESAKKGTGPIRLSEKREQATEERKAKEQKKKLEQKMNKTFGVIFSSYLDWAKENKKHWSNDKYRYENHLKELLEDARLKDINSFKLEQVKSKLSKKGLAPATVKHCLVIVRQVFNKAILWGKWDGNNPIKGVKLPKLDNQKLRVISAQEESLLLPALKEKSSNVHDLAVMSLYAGLRFSEIVSLRWQDIDFRNLKLSVAGKGGKRRTVPINSTVHALLENRRKNEQSETDLIFADRKGEIPPKISHSYFRVVDELKLNEGREKAYQLDFHSLRHTYATRLATAGTPLNVLRDLLGHTDLQMVSRYSHIIPSAADAAVKGLDSFRNTEVVNNKVSNG
jgi:integrase